MSMLPPTPTPALPAPQAWAQALRAELSARVLPWWQQALFDDEGRVLGGRDHLGRPLDAPRTAVLGTRLLWAFASAQVRLGATPAGAQATERALAWVSGPLSDPVHGGVFWSVDARGRPLAAHKQTYAQAFAIYALTAAHQWHSRRSRRAPQAWRSPALDQAWALFELIDRHARDPLLGGYFEGCTRDWQWMADTRLSALEPEAPKTTNTLLHVMEALTELLRCEPEGPGAERLRSRLRELIGLFLTRQWQPQRGAFGLFFTRAWQNLTPQVSWGHDIEAAWLLGRAVDGLADPVLAAGVRAVARQVADAVLQNGIDTDGSLLGAGLFDGRVTDRRRHWWCQAEALVGLHDAWQRGGDPRHAQAAWRVWRYIEQHHLDHEGGDWHKLLDAQGRVLIETPKAGPWECPYHHVRALLEMIERLEGRAPLSAPPRAAAPASPRAMSGRPEVPA